MKTLIRIVLVLCIVGLMAPAYADDSEVVEQSRVPLVLVVDGITVTVTAIYPNDGPMGSVTFDTPTQTACGAVFLTSQNGVEPDDVPDSAIIAAIAAVI